MKHYTTLILCVTILSLLPSCSTTQVRHLNSDQFLLAAKEIDQHHKIRWTNYIGCTMSRVYLETQSLMTLSGKPRTTVLWTELEKLPKELAARLKKGQSPWTTPKQKRERHERIRHNTTP